MRSASFRIRGFYFALFSFFALSVFGDTPNGKTNLEDVILSEGLVLAKVEKNHFKKKLAVAEITVIRVFAGKTEKKRYSVILKNGKDFDFTLREGDVYLFGLKGEIDPGIAAGLKRKIKRAFGKTVGALDILPCRGERFFLRTGEYEGCICAVIEPFDHDVPECLRDLPGPKSRAYRFVIALEDIFNYYRLQGD